MGTTGNLLPATIGKAVQVVNICCDTVLLFFSFTWTEGCAPSSPARTGLRRPCCLLRRCLLSSSCVALMSPPAKVPAARKLSSLQAMAMKLCWPDMRTESSMAK